MKRIGFCSISLPGNHWWSTSSDCRTTPDPKSKPRVDMVIASVINCPREARLPETATSLMNAQLIAKSDRRKGEVHSSLACNECHLVTDEEIHQAWSNGAKSLSKMEHQCNELKNADVKMPKPKCLRSAKLKREMP